MSIQEIESAVARLSPAELAQFAAWFEEYQADQWDQQIERDVRAGRLAPLIQAAERAVASGQIKPL